MSVEIEVPEAPNWLRELEAKREHRLKARLGHEAGAGAPCLTCEDKCPGLDLHFWRKICKVCKCPKESHDVPDDDIYGWAQFQLLGSKPNKIKKKIVLPGQKDEVELDWAPKGQKETIDKYLKTLPPESLPVKGSQAAQERKQMLQKQIPIHDIDPSLCHELTEDELKQMKDYIAHVKEKSVGVGQIISLASILIGNKHMMGAKDASIVASRYAKGVPSSEIVKLQGQSSANPLRGTNIREGIQGINLNDPAYSPNKINEKGQLPLANYLQANVNPGVFNQDPYVTGKMRDINYPNYSDNSKQTVPSGQFSKPFNKNSEMLQNELNDPRHVYSQGYSNPYFDNRFVPIEKLETGYNDPNYLEELNQLDPNYDKYRAPSLTNSVDDRSSLGSKFASPLGNRFRPIGSNKSQTETNSVDPAYQHTKIPPNVFVNESGVGGNFALSTPGNQFGNNQSNIFGREAQYIDPKTGEPYNQGIESYSENNQGLTRDNINFNKSGTTKGLPHYAGGSYKLFSDTQQPSKVGNIRDLAFSTYGPELPVSNETYGDPSLEDGNTYSPNHNQRVSSGPNTENPHHIPGSEKRWDPNIDAANTYSPNHNQRFSSVPSARNMPEGLQQIPGTVNQWDPSFKDESAYSPNHNQRFSSGPNIPENLPKPWNSPLEDSTYSPNQNQRYNNLGPNSRNMLENLQKPWDPSLQDANIYTPNQGQRCNSRDVAEIPGEANESFRNPLTNPYSPNHNQRLSTPGKKLTQLQPGRFEVPEENLQPNAVNIGAINDINYPEIKSATQGENVFYDDDPPQYNLINTSAQPPQNVKCHKCKKLFKADEFAVVIDRADCLFHPDCFRCFGCNQNLADNVYFYHKETDQIYCGRDFAKVRGFPRCHACDELIFTKEYCLTEGATFHIKHFCCYECDSPLANQNYVMEEGQPCCLPCFENKKASKCTACKNVIKPDEVGLTLKELHFHANDKCFACKVCDKPLLNAKLLLRNEKLYCSHDCFNADQ